MPSHFEDEISKENDRPAGNSRKAGDASADVKVAVVEKIISTATTYGLSQKDIANLIAIAKVESGFNPDAAAQGSWTSASGVFQVTDSTAKDATKRLSDTSRINNIKLSNYDRFDLGSNVTYGIAIYLDKKARAKSDDVGDIYKVWNSNPEEYNKYLDSLRKDSTSFEKILSIKEPQRISDAGDYLDTENGDEVFQYAEDGSLESISINVPNGVVVSVFSAEEGNPVFYYSGESISGEWGPRFAS